MFDYEWATVQHNVNCRLAQAVVVPDAIPPARLDRYGARGKLRPYAGLKEEYYLADFEPDAGVLGRARARPRAPDRGRAHPAGGLALSPVRERPVRRVLDRLRGTQAVVLPRTPEQRDELLRAGGFDRAASGRSTPNR